ncbi:lamin tail domain-containing protein, partial [Nevskia ramosa]|uniref:lamin tail domain-containing protein n=1 Tax=Nevskia ramosa TaxID=64002 RepID=UPI0023540009
MKVLVAAAATLFSAGSAFAQAAGGVVISQFAVRGPAGGNDEFVEIFNTGSSPIAIGGWTLQGCANGTPGNPSVRATVPGGTSLAAGQFYLFANTAAAGYSLGVAPDATYATGITDLSTAGFSGIRLVPSNSVALSGVAIDGVGSGASPCREGSGIVTPSTTGANTAFLRRLIAGVVQDGNDNATDFPGPAAAGAPRNSATIIGGGGGNLPTVSLAVEPAAFSELGGSAVVTATLSAASTSPVTVNLVFGGAASSGTDYSASSASLSIPAGELSATLTLSAIDDSIFEGDETITATLGTLSNASAGTPNNVTATIVENDQAPPPTVGARIYQIQGAQHRSPMVNMAVSNVPGIVTARAANGFYMQDGDGDGNPATSDGIFVFTSTAPPVAAAVGAQVLVSGTVSEFRPGNDAENLTVTQIGSPTVTPYVGNALFTNTVITPTILGNGGRIPPTDIIDNDSLGNVETSGTSLFDPAQDGLDFDESLEGMLVQVNNARATGPRNSFGEVWVLGDNGSNATGVTARGGVALVERATGIDYNPERIQLDDGLNGITMPAGINTGDSLGTVTGVISYSFDNYELLLTQAPTVTVNPLPPGVRSIQVGGDRLSVGAYNVENLDPNDTSFARLAGQIVNAIGAPDVLALSELQDNNGATNNGVVAADATIQLLRDAIVAAGGPSYAFQQINPAAGNPDGGEPGGNIRVVQFYNPLRVTFVPGTVGSGGSLDATAPTLAGGKLALTLSPGRVAPTDSAWNSSRKPLAVTYDFNGRRVVIINVHFNSKGGDQPLFGVNQPAVLS